MTEIYIIKNNDYDSGIIEAVVSGPKDFDFKEAHESQYDEPGYVCFPHHLISKYGFKWLAVKEVNIWSGGREGSQVTGNHCGDEVTPPCIASDVCRAKGSQGGDD